MAKSDISIDSRRLWGSLMAMAEIGPLPGGGSRRLSLSDEDKTARDLFVSWCREAGCLVEVDPIGNIFATRPGREPGRAAIMTGSHLDTQPDGGRFDGIYGVLAGLEVIRCLNDNAIETEAPVTVVNWTNEEGVRFAPGLTGSSVFARSLPLADALAMQCIDGPTVGEELQRIGYDGTLPVGTIRATAYLEAHIEQGPVLERLGKPVGIVEGVQGVRWLQVEIRGQGRHAGTTPMEQRADGFMAAARVALEARQLALEASPDIRFTVGRIAVLPGSPNTIPASAVFTIDLRHPSEQVLDMVEESIVDLLHKVGQAERVQTGVSPLMTVPSVAFDSGCVAALAGAADAAAIPAERIFSGAMHDASSVARAVPSAMIFVPCRDGISHNVAEWAEPEDLAAGCQVLLLAVLQLAECSPDRYAPAPAR